MLNVYQFPQAVISALAGTVYNGMVYRYEPVREISQFYDVGMINEGRPTGEYELVISGTTVAGRAKLLEGSVPAGFEKQAAYEWITAHELGHAMQSAFAITHPQATTEGIFVGIDQYQRPQESYIYKTIAKELIDLPYSEKSKAFLKAVKLEGEREAEGFAALLLREGLVMSGVYPDHTDSIIERIYRHLQEKTRDIDFASLDPDKEEDYKKIQKIGYANPLSVEELKERFSD